MHTSIHFNGWGNYPNPSGYTTAPIHAPFEGSFVHNFIDFNTVNGQVRPYTDRGVNNIEQRVPLYLAESLSQVVPTYAAAQASGNDNYQTAQPAEVAVVTKQLAAGVAELRDEIVDAWRQSEQIAIGFPLVRVTDIESHIVQMTTTTLGLYQPALTLTPGIPKLLWM
jgi:3-oxoacyl-(acyl-carrier-protein) synthase